MSKGSNQSSRVIAIGLMLFALFFGAGNLIFPSSMGQNAGYNVWWSVLGFIISGVGLPLAGVLAMGYSGCEDLHQLASRVGLKYGLVFSVVVYLTIGPWFCIPRTGSVSYEIAVRPFLNSGGSDMEMTAFLVLFFIISYWLSANPSKLVDRIGKILTPCLLVTIVMLILKSYLTPMGVPQAPTAHYATASMAAVQGFIDGYGTMDAMGSFVFAILVIKFVKENGADTPQKVTRDVFKAGLLAAACLGFVYVFIADLGATSVQALGILETGAPVLANSALILFGNAGAILLAVIVLLACLSTSIGLLTSCATFFNEIYDRISYTAYLRGFTIVSFLIGTFGLLTIIKTAIPVLMFLYPLTVATIFLTFMHNVFNGNRIVYISTIGFTCFSALISGLETAGVPLGSLSELMNTYVPFQAIGLGWIIFALTGFVVGLIAAAILKKPETLPDEA